LERTQQRVAETTNRVAAARASLRGVNTTVLAAEKQLSAAFATGNPILAQSALRVGALAVGTRALATQELEQAKVADQQEKANARNARSQAQLSRGAQATLLSLGGIRGATLAASRSFLVGAATITVFSKAVQQFADLETNLEVFRATAA